MLLSSTARARLLLLAARARVLCVPAAAVAAAAADDDGDFFLPEKNPTNNPTTAPPPPPQTHTPAPPPHAHTPHPHTPTHTHTHPQPQQIADLWSSGVMLYVMLVGAYPFERPEDKADHQKLQKMIQRILHVDYAVPGHIRLSDDCKDLLKQVCVVGVGCVCGGVRVCGVGGVGGWVCGCLRVCASLWTPPP